MLAGIIYSHAVCRSSSEQAGSIAGAGRNQLCLSKAGSTGKARQDFSGWFVKNESLLQQHARLCLYWQANRVRTRAGAGAVTVHGVLVCSLVWC